MKNNLILLLFLTPLFAVAQQVDKLYTVGGTLYPTTTLDGIGINEDKPDAALHINQSDDKGTALQIDLEFTTSKKPAYAFKINSLSSNVIPIQLSPYVINISNLAMGTYIATITTEQNSFSTKIFKTDQ